MEHRYADEPEPPSWYTGRRYTTDPEVSGSHRVPEQRDLSESGRIPIRGPEYPAVRPTPAAEQTGPFQPLAPQAPQAPVQPAGPQTPADRVYQTRRPVSSLILLGILAILLVPALRLLATVTFTADPAAGGIVPAVLLTLGLAMTGFGLFAVGSGPITRDSWTRAPHVYLPVGLIVLLAAGLAAA
ncbi:hypothetical protein AB0M02_04590 [Actinoplanes sp. NPDC051861]|uniref:hypothetical protein n=1 Tax=Actinoplanes sp. NPDC051861 TaxID=3155170 RepID=UPI00341FE3F4